MAGIFRSAQELSPAPQYAACVKTRTRGLDPRSTGTDGASIDHHRDERLREGHAAVGS